MIAFFVFCILMIMVSQVFPGVIEGGANLLFWLIDVAFKFTIGAFVFTLVFGVVSWLI